MSILFWLVFVIQLALLIFVCLLFKSFRQIECHICTICEVNERPKGQAVTLEKAGHPPDKNEKLPQNLTQEIVNEWFYGAEKGKVDEE